MPHYDNLDSLYAHYLQCPHVQTDTRRITKDEIFFALKGAHFNGHDFVAKAMDAGASAVVVSEENVIPATCSYTRFFLVRDTLQTLQALALQHRKTFAPAVPFLAITGSNAKTTTKELIACVLQKKYNIYATQGNLNNHIGVPLTLLSVPRDANFVVVEMGANHPHEIADLCAIALPNYGLITNCGKAHLEGFGSEENVRKAKGELFDFFRTQIKNSTPNYHFGGVFICTDYAYLLDLAQGLQPQLTYATQANVSADIYGRIVENTQNFLLHVKVQYAQHTQHTCDVFTQLFGAYNLPNVLAAFRVGLYFGVPVADIIDALAQYTPTLHRSQVVEQGTRTFIVDAYNANPTSMRSAISHFARPPFENKILILGAMGELGTHSEVEHATLVQWISEFAWREVWLVGRNFQAYAKAPLKYFENALSVKKYLSEHEYKGCTFLVKGSRSVGLEKIIAEK